MKTRKRISSRLRGLGANFECGGCTVFFDSVYLLHDHMRDHEEGGSYYYNNTTKTAFPVSEATDASTQTCPSDIDSASADNLTELIQNIKRGESSDSQNIKREESSDSDNCEDYAINWSDVNTENSEHSNLENLNGMPNPNGSLPFSLTDSRGPDSLEESNTSEEKTLKQASKLKWKDRHLNHMEAKLNKKHKMGNSEPFTRQLLPHLDLKVSLRRIDETIKTEIPQESAASEDFKIKDFLKSDDMSAKQRYKESEKLRIQPKGCLRRNKTRAGLKPKSAVYANSRLEKENKKTDPDYNPKGNSVRPLFNYTARDPDISEAGNNDLYWKKAKSDCKHMKCGHCNKFTDNDFTKANLLALHNIPFRHENGRLLIDANKALHKTDTFSVNMFERKSLVPRWIVKIRCDECGKILSRETMRMHKIKFHNAPRKSKGRPQKEKYYQCPICNKVVRRDGKRRHERTHIQKPELEEDEDSVICEVCGQMCSNKRSLSNHMNTHSLKRLSCKYCDHVSSSARELERHVKIHGIVHNCGTCGKTFSRRRGLLEHINKVHKKIKNSVCDICGRQFYCKSKMEDHRSTHFAPSLECGYCDKKFRDRNCLKKHRMTHTGEVTYTCYICNHGFIQSTPYWTHMQKKHSISREEAMTIHRQNKESNEQV